MVFEEGYRDRFLQRQRLIGDTVLIHDESAVGLDTAMDIVGLERFVELYDAEPAVVSDWMRPEFGAPSSSRASIIVAIGPSIEPKMVTWPAICSDPSRRPILPP